jgi:hypothetical protein
MSDEKDNYIPTHSWTNRRLKMGSHSKDLGSFPNKCTYNMKAKACNEIIGILRVM